MKEYRRRMLCIILVNVFCCVMLCYVTLCCVTICCVMICCAVVCCSPVREAQKVSAIHKRDKVVSNHSIYWSYSTVEQSSVLVVYIKEWSIRQDIYSPKILRRRIAILHQNSEL